MFLFITLKRLASAREGSTVSSGVQVQGTQFLLSAEGSRVFPTVATVPILRHLKFPHLLYRLLLLLMLEILPEMLDALVDRVELLAVFLRVRVHEGVFSLEGPLLIGTQGLVLVGVRKV